MRGFVDTSNAVDSDRDGAFAAEHQRPVTCVDDLADCGLRFQKDTCHLFGVVGPLIGPMRPPANDAQVTVIHHRQASGVQRFQQSGFTECRRRLLDAGPMGGGTGRNTEQPPGPSCSGRRRRRYQENLPRTLLRWLCHGRKSARGQ